MRLCIYAIFELHILKLGDQYKFEATLFMHNYAIGKLPVSFANMCTFNYESQANVQTRQSNLIRLPRCNSSFASKLPKYNFPNLWNNWVLKDQVNLTLSPSQNKKKLKDTFLSAYAHSVVCTNSHCIACRNWIFLTIHLTNWLINIQSIIFLWFWRLILLICIHGRWSTTPSL